MFVGDTVKAQADSVNISDFDVAHAHVHEGAGWKTAKQVGVALVGKLHECRNAH